MDSCDDMRAPWCAVSASRYFHTVRYLRPVQVFGRLRFRLIKPRPNLARAPALRPLAREAWVAPARRRKAMLAPRRFCFLNVERELASASDWNNPSWQKLWLYNLHYFDDLNAEGSQARSNWHHPLIQRWITENPPPEGNAWESYTLSLRIVNWIKWGIAGNSLSAEALHSLAVQSRYLRRRLEHHLLGNHLFANGKALVFAGIFFCGDEADEWLSKGLQILAREMHEQILPDGGHFELSPMYHNIILVDVLDILNLLRIAPDALQLQWESLLLPWRRSAESMLKWARSVTHPDGDFALVNDAAFGIASSLAEIERYGSRLGVHGEANHEAVAHLADSGYIRMKIGHAWALLDVGRIGPDYLPGHAHADTLSFELSVFGRRVLVDSGTSIYDVGEQRLRQRSTAAHNTVEINGENSSEVWGSFRVARRAYPLGLELLEGGDIIRVRCAHDGYKRLSGRPIHCREWTFHNSGLAVNDVVEGAFRNATARFHFHPDCSLVQSDDRSGFVRLGLDGDIRWCVEAGRPRVVESTYHPEFGLTFRSKSLEVELIGARARTLFDWAA